MIGTEGKYLQDLVHTKKQSPQGVEGCGKKVTTRRLQQDRRCLERQDGMPKDNLCLYQEIGTSVKGVCVGGGASARGCKRARHETRDIY